MPKHTPATPLKIAGEVQMKALSHEMTVLRRTNERLVADRARLVEALRNLSGLVAAYPKTFNAAEVNMAEYSRNAQDLLAELGE